MPMTLKSWWLFLYFCLHSGDLTYFPLELPWITTVLMWSYPCFQLPTLTIQDEIRMKTTVRFTCLKTPFPMSLPAWESLMFNYFQWDQDLILKICVNQGSRTIVCILDEVVILRIRPKQLCKKLGKWKSERWVGAWEKSLSSPPEVRCIAAGVEPWGDLLEDVMEGCASASGGGSEAAVGEQSWQVGRRAGCRVEESKVSPHFSDSYYLWP